jgi:hypothetical protein
MSHFAVLVAVPADKTLDDVLLPYHEYECTGIEKYLQFVPCDQEELKADFEKHGEDQTLEEFAKDWGGYTLDADTQQWGRTTNPNKKWDWWQTGGRWNHYLGINEGTKAQFDFEKQRITRLDKNTETLRQWKAARETEPTDAQVGNALKTLADHWKDHEPAKKLYAGDAIALAKDEMAFNAIDRHFWSVQNAEQMRLTEDEYIAQTGYNALVHAFVDLEGKWIEIGDMGWWGMCNDENKSSFDGKDGKFWQFINSLPDDTMLCLVDCHI